MALERGEASEGKGPGHLFVLGKNSRAKIMQQTVECAESGKKMRLAANPTK